MRWGIGVSWLANEVPADYLTEEEKAKLEKLHGPNWGNFLLVNTVKLLLAERSDL